MVLNGTLSGTLTFTYISDMFCICLLYSRVCVCLHVYVFVCDVRMYVFIVSLSVRLLTYVRVRVCVSVRACMRACVRACVQKFAISICIMREKQSGDTFSDMGGSVTSALLHTIDVADGRIECVALTVFILFSKYTSSFLGNIS